MQLTITEAEFQRQVLECAKLYAWRVAHFRYGQNRSGRWMTPVQADAAGFPDLLLLRGGNIMVAELKVGRNKTTADQSAWLDAFARTGVPAFLWRPEAWAEIEATLRDGPAPMEGV